jgi:ATP-dependent exoDNAse (exonuclease V) beta subunit
LQSSFKIYNASAGSGKTFTLVKEYLKLLIAAPSTSHFKHILAVTFTNKAAGEMKSRIIEALKLFSNEAILKDPNSMFEAICMELQVEPAKLHEKSKTLLQEIVYNYAAFDISTIDGFTHKVIRTFAYDLKLPLNFEVELDTQRLLKEVVDSLINKAGTNKELTNILVDFAIEKIDDDKSWDIAFDLNKIAKLLLSENDLPYIQALKNKSFHDFKALKTQLQNDLKTTAVDIVTLSQNVLLLIEECGLQFEDFSRGSVPKYFQKLAHKDLEVAFENNWQTALINNESLYPKRVTPEIASTIDDIQPQIITAFSKSKQLVFHYKFTKAFYKNITPLSVLNAINNELKAVKEDQNKLLISEFNSLIHEEIKDQPTPFIYERLGEKFRHYFIDEFQDTSTLQWQNLMPLIDNALSNQNNSTMLVGDAKQAIYRWRGGEAEQFINLYNKTEDPFQINQEVLKLSTNYRSAEAIINFNNNFFEYAAQNAFTDLNHKGLFLQATQETFIDHDGFVSLSFLDLDKDDDQNLAYANKVLEVIKTSQTNGFNLSDLCILVREKKQGLALANFLSDASIDIISSDSLLLKNSPEILFINNVLSVLTKPSNVEAKINMLNYLASTLHIEDKHTFFTKHVHAQLEVFFTALESYNIYFDYKNTQQQVLYDTVETIIRAFNLVEKSNAYIQFYLDVVFEYSQKQIATIQGFLEYYDTKQDNLSIVSPEGQNAIQILTVHKSKGLEFPVVIYPYASTNIYKDIEPKEWLEVDPEQYHGFSHALLDYSKNFEHYNSKTQTIYTKHQAALELDSLNILYVALTRPSQQLHIISEKDINKKGEANAKSYAGLFINYLKSKELWSDSQLEYTFGNNSKNSQNIGDKTNTITEQLFISNSLLDHTINIVTTSALFWDTKQGEAIEKGTLIHKLFSHIKTKNDIDFVVNDALKTGLINKDQVQEIKPLLSKVVSHELLKIYFDDTLKIYNECEIISPGGAINIPDRVVVNAENEAVIIDYKTGLESNKHIHLVQVYQDLLESMGFTVTKKILVYINDDILVKEF